MTNPSWASVVPQIAALHEVKKMGRALRKPQHRFSLQTQPWQIQPFLLAPVLPGETLKNCLMQARAVSDPLLNKLQGWWKEYYFFYVKLRDLDDRDALTAMLVTGSGAPAATAASVPHYYRGDGVNYSSKCLDRVVNEFFRADGEAVTIATTNGIPLAAIDVKDFTQSLIIDGPPTLDTGEELPGENPALPANMSAFADQFTHWEAMRDLGLVDATFEDWLRSFGVKVAKDVREDSHRPELLRYVRNFTYPVNTIDPADGSASSAAVWSCAERLDKDRFFNEPGFIFAVTVTRPKVYKSKLEAAGAAYLNDPYMWLPAVLSDAPYTSLKEFSATDGPCAAVMTSGYWVDMKDLFLHGDQFINHSYAADVNAVALPTVALENDYATTADGDAMFVDAAGGYKWFREDGIVSLTIASASANVDTSL